MKGKVPVDYALFKINEIFRVVDISNNLVSAKDIDEAKDISSKMNFDRVPIKKNGKILTYYCSNSNSELNIEPDYILSDSLGIFQTFGYLSRKDFYFILSGNELTHIVHYSDLNRPLSLIGIYTQIAYCEMAIRDFARLKNSDNTEDGIKKFLKDLNSGISSPNKKIDINETFKRFKKKPSDMQTNVFDELYFKDELVLFRELVNSALDSDKKAKFKNFINLDDSTIVCFRDLRNDIMHSKQEIIKKSPDVSKMLNFLQACQNIINVTSGKTVFQ